MGVHVDDPRSPLAVPRRRRSLRRRVAELERLLADVENDAAQALAEQQAWLRAVQAEVVEMRDWRVPGLRARHDHDPAVARLLKGERDRKGYV